MPAFPRLVPLRVVLALVVATVLTACDQPKIRVYSAPRDLPAGERPATESNSTEPRVTWTLPTGWEETPPGQMSLASFAVSDASGRATVSITPLPNLKGQEEAVINMWREQVGLGPVPKEEVEKSFQPTEIAGDQGQSFEIKGEREGKVVRTVTGFTHRSDGSWFVKISGDDAIVTAQKAAFFAFLKSLHIHSAGEAPHAHEQASKDPLAAPTKTPTPPAGVEGMAFKWTVPSSWTTVPPGQMQVAKFNVPEKDGAKGEVSVSKFPSDTGGTLANVNRWRRQIGLGEVDEAGLKPLTSPIEGLPGALLVNLVNEQRQMLGAIVPRDGEYWFYKLVGDAPAVASAHDDFVRFVSTAP